LIWHTKPNPAPKIAVEVLIGHGKCHVIIETTAELDTKAIDDAVHRIAGNVETDIVIVPQDVHLSYNQQNGFRCGDNGIFKGMPVTPEQMKLSAIANASIAVTPATENISSTEKCLILCQSNARRKTSLLFRTRN
jgi:S-adenosylmethionine synthetase